jgi:hypothetical protein
VVLNTKKFVQTDLGFLISNFCRVLYVVCFLLGNSRRLNFICRPAIPWPIVTRTICISHNCPRPPCGSLPFQNLLCNRTHPYSVKLLPIGLGYFWAKPSPVWILQLFSNLVIIHLPAYKDGTDSVPKRRHIKFRCRGITQKKKTFNRFSFSPCKHFAQNAY